MAHRSSGGSPISIAGVHKNHGQISRDRRFRLQGNSPFSESNQSRSVNDDLPDETIDAQRRSQVPSPPSKAITANDCMITLGSPLADQSSIEEPNIVIQRSNRRSHVLSACMSKERVSYRPMGRGKDGTFHYAIYLEECQGFCWNTNLQKFNSRIMPEMGSSFYPFGDTIYDVFSEDEDDDEDSYHNLHTSEIII